MRVLKPILWGIGGLILLLLVAAGLLYVATIGDYTVPATVMDDPDLPRIEINGAVFHAETFGEPENPVVIVLHGGPGGDYRSLLGLQELADEYFVVFYDQRGAGLSARVPDEELTYQVMLADLDAFIEHFGLGEPVYLIGHSWGAMLASGYLGVAPEKVAKAVLGEPGFLSAQEAADWQATYKALVIDLKYYWEALRAGFEAMHVSGPDADASQDYLVGVRMLHYFTNHPDNPYHCPGEPFDAPAWRFGTRAGTAIQTSASDADLDSLGVHAVETQTPILFLAGACDTWLGADLQAQHAALYPNARLEVIPDAGHDMFWDNHAASLAAVRAFLAE